jgi:hypothetical protein
MTPTSSESRGASSKEQVLALLHLIQISTNDAIEEYEKRGYNVPYPHTRKPNELDSAEDILALKKAIRTLESACEVLCTTLAPPMHTVFNVRLSHSSDLC